MPEHLAIEWDGYEARVAVARSRGAEIVIAHAFCVGLLPRDSGPSFADVNVGERIAAALAAPPIDRAAALEAHSWGARLSDLFAIIGEELASASHLGAHIELRPVVHYPRSQRRV